MKKGIFILIILIIFIPLSSVSGQTGLNSINTSINVSETHEISVSSSLEGDILYMNLTISDGYAINVNIYRGVSHLPIDEIYNGGGTGTFEANITLLGGSFTIYLYNPVDNGAVIFVHGGWAINYEPPEPTTTTEEPTTTTGTWTGPTRPVDIFAMFWSIFFSLVIPALVTLLILYIIWYRCYRMEHYDYLATFEKDELLVIGKDDDD